MFERPGLPVSKRVRLIANDESDALGMPIGVLCALRRGDIWGAMKTQKTDTGSAFEMADALFYALALVSY